MAVIQGNYNPETQENQIINNVDLKAITLECLVIPMIHNMVIGRTTLQNTVFSDRYWVMITYK